MNALRGRRTWSSPLLEAFEVYGFDRFLVVVIVERRRGERGDDEEEVDEVVDATETERGRVDRPLEATEVESTCGLAVVEGDVEARSR